MRVLFILLAMGVLACGDDGADLDGAMPDASAFDMMMPIDGSVNDSMTSADVSTPDAAIAPDGAAPDATVPDVMVTDAEIVDGSIEPDRGMVEISPVDPCGEDLQVVCGTVIPHFGMVVETERAGLDPSAPGDYAVETTVTQINGPRGDEIPITIYAPYERGVPLIGPMPLVLVLPGFGFSHTGYPHFTEHLASHGFMVVGADVATGGFMDPAVHDQKTEKVLAVLDWALADSPVAERLDADKVASIGHSLGGKLSFYAAALDSRIDMVVAWDPQNGGGPPCFLGDPSCNDFPVAPNCESNESGLIHQIRAESLTFGAEDLIFTPDVHLRADRFYRGAPSPAHFVSMPAAGHAAWSGGGEVSVLSRGVHTALLLNRMMGVTGLDEWLPGGEQLEMAPSVEAVYSK